TRIGRKNVSKTLLEKTPVILKAYDVLEWEGKDIRETAFAERRKILEKLYSDISAEYPAGKFPLHLSETISFTHCDEVTAERDRARGERSVRLMLKRVDSPYLVG